MRPYRAYITTKTQSCEFEGQFCTQKVTHNIQRVSFVVPPTNSTQIYFRIENLDGTIADLQDVAYKFMK